MKLKAKVISLNNGISFNFMEICQKLEILQQKQSKTLCSIGYLSQMIGSLYVIFQEKDTKRKNVKQEIKNTLNTIEEKLMMLQNK